MCGRMQDLFVFRKPVGEQDGWPPLPQGEGWGEGDLRRFVNEPVPTWSVCRSRASSQPRRHSGERRNPEGLEGPPTKLIQALRQCDGRCR